jgi:multidrug transporter EmrE-like cation transporter
MGLAIVLVFVGTLMYKEALTPTKFAGIALCLAGMFLISK